MRPTPGRDVWRSSGNEHAAHVPLLLGRAAAQMLHQHFPRNANVQKLERCVPLGRTPPRNAGRQKRCFGGWGQAQLLAVTAGMRRGGSVGRTALRCAGSGCSSPRLRGCGMQEEASGKRCSAVCFFSKPSQQLQRRRSRCGVCYCRVGAASSMLEGDIAVLTRCAKLFSAPASPNLTHARSQSGGEWGGMGDVKLSGDPSKAQPNGVLSPS